MPFAPTVRIHADRISLPQGYPSMAHAPTRTPNRRTDFRGATSECAGILERTGEHRAMGVERRLELLGGAGASTAPVLEMPTLGWREHADVAFAELARPGRAFRGCIEPNGEITCVEGKRRRGRRAAPGPCTMTSHMKTVQRVRHCFVPV
jgi:hypothetical protein